MMRFTPPLAPAGRHPDDGDTPVTYVWSGARQRLRRHLTELTFTTLAALGICCMLSVVLGLAIGFRPLLLRSGSMTPAMPVGTLALSRSVDASGVRAGDIVSVVRGDTRVTHRVVGTRSDAGVPELTLQGDANAAPDAEPVRAARVDRVVWSVPAVGHLLERFGEPRTQFVVGVLTGVALTWSFGSAGAGQVGRWVPITERRGRRASRLRGRS